MARKPVFRAKGTGGIGYWTGSKIRVIKKAHGRPRKEQVKPEPTTFRIMSPGEQVWERMLKETY